MALIQLGANITGISGKQGGTVYSRNRFGAYTRNKTIPVNVSNTKTSLVRDNFRSAASKWKTLTSVERTSWNNFAANYTYTNVFGEAKKLTGFQLFVGGQSRLHYMGIAPSDLLVNSVPSQSGVINAQEFVWDGTGLLITTVNSADWVIANNQSAILFGSQEVPNSQAYGSNKNKMRFLGVMGTDGFAINNSDDFKTLWQGVFGTQSPTLVGNGTWLTVQMIDNSSGVITNTQTFYAPVI